MRWEGFRKVRKQVCKRLSRRIDALGLADLATYTAYLDSHPEEWSLLDGLCRISITRFYRDRAVFDRLRLDVLPSLAQRAIARGDAELRCWSVGCCSGEEPYTLQMLWKLCVAPTLPIDLPLHIMATDTDPAVLQRARLGVYPGSALKDLPGELHEQAFSHSNENYTIWPVFTRDVTFVEEDIRKQLPPGHFDLILCRNLVFTYFDSALQRDLLARIVDKLIPGGILVIGIHESIPAGIPALTPYDNRSYMYQKVEGA